MFENLNELQLKAVIHKPGPVLLIAGPGSGKTFTIVNRINFLINKLNVLPERILVITFTRDAALSMFGRFHEQSNGIYPVNFGTFHSVFYNLLKNSIKFSDYNLISLSDKKKIIYSVIKQMSIQSDSISFSDMFDKFSYAFSYYKNTLDIEQAKLLLGDKFSDCFMHFFNLYENIRHKKKLLDFDDMVYDFYMYLNEDYSFRAEVQSKYDHILIDEYQDINMAQFNAISILGEKSIVFAVGDDDQSIYGFRGSKPEFMNSFCEKYNADILYLNENYRSSSHIVDASLKVINENSDRFTKALFANKTSKSQFNLINSFEDEDKEKQFILKAINDISCANKTTAILFRTNIQMQSFGIYLKEKGIKFTIKEKKNNLVNHFIIKDIYDYLILSREISLGLMNEGYRNRLLNIVNKPLRYISREAFCGYTNNLFNDAKEFYYNTKPYNYLLRIKELTKLENDLKFISNKAILLKVKYILKNIGYEKYLSELAGTNKTLREEYYSIIELLNRLAKKANSEDEFMQIVSDFGSKLVDNTDSNLILMTVHASKGLEFDNVIIPDCNENIYPYSAYGNENIQEERRLLYVAMTRAKENLLITFIYNKKSGFKIPSRFLNPLMIN